MSPKNRFITSNFPPFFPVTLKLVFNRKSSHRFFFFWRTSFGIFICTLFPSFREIVTFSLFSPCESAVRRYNEPLNQYLYMIDLLDRNERLFYKLLSENVEELVSLEC